MIACASASPPPGGPEDKAPPQLVRVAPDTNAVNVGSKYASFYFDETINDRGTGVQAIDSHFLVSPSDGAPRVEWHRSRIDVSPRHGFRANTAYTVTLLPGLSDLRSNAMKTGATVVFSTGPVIPIHRIKGIVFDWITERPAANAYIEAVSPDSVVYLAQADSVGQFTVGPMNPGVYLVRGIIDANTNRALDRNEAFDSVRVTVPQSSLFVEVLAAPRDTLPVRLLTVSHADSVTLKVSFDRAVDPTQPVTPAAFHLVASDSSVVPIASVLSPRQERIADSLAQKVAADSLRRMADSLRRVDSLAGKPVPPVVVPTPTPATRRAAGARPINPPPETPSKPAPFTTLTLKLGRPLAPNAEFRLSMTGLRSLTGRSSTSERRFTTPKPLPVTPPADSAAKTPPATRASPPPKTPPTTAPARR